VPVQAAAGSLESRPLGNNKPVAKNAEFIYFMFAVDPSTICQS